MNPSSVNGQRTESSSPRISGDPPLVPTAIELSHRCDNTTAPAPPTKGHLFSVTAGILPAVEPGILAGGIGLWFGKPLPIGTSDPGGKMPPSTAAKMAAATDVNPTLNTYTNGGEGRAFAAPKWLRPRRRGEEGCWPNSDTPLPVRSSRGEGEHRFLPAAVGALRAAAFTLVELLTVIAVLAVLASLLMTAVASAKKKSRTAICMVNLHQISLALDMYLDDFGKRPPSVDDLVSGKYLPAPRSLLCPEDRTGNWGRLVQSGNLITIIGEPVGGPPAASNAPVRYSYLLHPLSWDDMTWDRLMQAGGSAGVAACQLHGLGTQDVPDVHRFSGLLLRAQKDGAVVRRRIFWATEALPTFTTFGTPGSVPDLYPLQIYLDDPAHWFQSSP